MGAPPPTPGVLPRVARATFVAVGTFPWVLPLLRAWLPLGVVGDGLDAAFITMCHRLPERTLVLAGVAMPLCSRCSGIFAGVAVGALAVWPQLSARAWRWVITAAAAAMVLDVATQDLGLHPVWHATRLASGFAFGYAIAAACIMALRLEADEAASRLQSPGSRGAPRRPP
jgi:uncharacterized membrane protein